MYWSGFVLKLSVVATEVHSFSNFYLYYKRIVTNLDTFLTFFKYCNTVKKFKTIVYFLVNYIIYSKPITKAKK